MEADKTAFKFDFWDNVCPFLIKKLSNKNKYDKKRQFFEGALSKLEYYTDGITFLKKMIEVDIIKHYLFSTNERKLLSILANPDYTKTEESIILKRIEDEYKPKKYIPERLDDILKEVLDESRNKEGTIRLLQLIQLGNHNIINSQDD